MSFIQLTDTIIINLSEVVAVVYDEGPTELDGSRCAVFLRNRESGLVLPANCYKLLVKCLLNKTEPPRKEIKNV